MSSRETDLAPSRMEPRMDPRTGRRARDLVAHVARFGRALRDRGAGVTLADEADALAALPLVDLSDRPEVRRALRSALKIRPRDRELFDALFEEWWSPRAVPGGPGGPPPAERKRRRPAGAARRRGRPGRTVPLAAPRAEEPRSEGTRRVPEGGREPAYSPDAVLRRKPFDECSAAELEAMERLLSRLALRLATHPSRRRVPTRGPGEPDLRRSFRGMVATGGEPLHLARRRRPVELPRLVVLCDTSGSMDPHARFLLAFLLALRKAARGSEVFAFNTSLVRVTPLLRIGLRPGRSDAALGPLGGALALLGAQVPDWSGGTRIAECLSEFVARHLDELVSSRTVVIVVSDGLDRGDLDALPDAMGAIHRRARRVLWLNPLAGDPRYEPTARAMAAALPYVDRLLPAHNLESLERLLPHLAA